MKRLKPALMSVCMLAAMILAVFMPAGTAMAAADYSFIRVLLSTPHSTADIDITVNGSYTIKEKPDYKVTNGKYTVKLSGATVQLVKDGVTTSIGTKCTFVPANYTSTSNTISLKNSRYGTCKYLGDVFFYKNRYRVDKNTVVDKLHVVNRVPMEQYLYGVIGYEIGSGSHIEALKAQAVAARGYAINQLAPGEPNYEVGDTSSYQVYHGYDGNARVIQAVDATRGQVVSYNGKVCNTFFGASNGGQTELPGNAFGGGSSKNAQYPYLVQKDDPYDLANTASREQMFLIPKQIDSVTGDVVVVNKGCTNVRVRSATNTSDNTNILAEVDGGASFPYVGETGDWYIILYNGKNAYISKQFTAKQNNGGSGNFPYSYASSQLNALQKAVYNALGSSNVSSQNNIQLVSVQSIKNGTEQWPGTGSRCYATATAVVNVRYLNNSGSVITKDGVKCTLTLLEKSEGKYVYEDHAFFNEELRMRGVEEVKSGGQVTGWNLVARRYGHGVGMSQRGAQQRARDDQSYQEILAFYYDKTQLITVNTGAGAVVDNDPPHLDISKFKIEGGEPVYTKKFKMSISDVSDDVSGVYNVAFEVWSNAGGQDDVHWYSADLDTNGVWSCQVDLANHNNQLGTYSVRVHSYDNAMNLASTAIKEFTVDIDEQGPVFDAMNITPNPAQSIFTVSAGVTDAKSGVNNVAFEVWCEEGGQDDVRWYGVDNVVQQNGIYTCEINIADHGYQTGNYIVNVHAYDKVGNLAGRQLGTVTVSRDETPPTIQTETLSLTNGKQTIDSTQFGVQISGVTDSGSGVKLVEFEVWCADGGKDDAKKYAAVEKDGIWSCEVDMANHKNQKGDYVVKAYAYDKAGNVSETKEKTFISSFDTVGPVIDQMNVSPNPAAGLFTASARVTDAKSGVRNVAFEVWCEEGGQDDVRWYGAGYVSQQGDIYTCDVNALIHDLQLGTYIINVHAYDNEMNLTSQRLGTVEVVKDTVLPSIQTENISLKGDQQTIASEEFEVQVTGVTDEGSGVLGVVFEVWSKDRGRDTAMLYEGTFEKEGVWSCKVNIADHGNQKGDYVVVAYASDCMLNISNTDEKVFATDFDTVGPVIEEMTATPKETESEFTVSAKATDAKSGVYNMAFEVWCEEGGQDDVQWYSGKEMGDGVYSATINAANHKNQKGTYIINVHSYDKAMNLTSQRLGAVKVTGDVTPPQLSADNITLKGGQSTIASTKFEVQITGVTDTGTGVRNVAFEVWCEDGGQDDVQWYSAKDQGNGTWACEVDMANHKNQKGNYVVKAHAYDKAMNLGSTAEKVFATDFDTVGPVIEEMTATPKETESEFTVSAKATDAKSGVYNMAFEVWCEEGGQDDVQWYSGKEMGDGVYSATINAANHKNQKGTYIINVHSYDKAMNLTSQRLGTVKVTGDVTPPVIEQMKVVGGSPVKEDSFAVEVTAKDSSGAVSVTFEVLSPKTATGEPHYYMTEIKGDNIYSADIHLLDYMNAKGTYQVQATVIDEAGNKSTQVLPVEVAYEYNKQGTITANDVNVRSSFSTESASLGKVHKGDTFKVLSEVDTMDSYGKWIAIDYNGKLGYVVATYVTVIDLGGTPPSEPAAPPAGAEGWVLIIKANVNIRSGPDTGSQSLGMANKGDKFEYLGEENGWYALTYNGQKAYVRQDMAEVVKE